MKKHSTTIILIISLIISIFAVEVFIYASSDNSILLAKKKKASEASEETTKSDIETKDSGKKGKKASDKKDQEAKPEKDVVLIKKTLCVLSFVNKSNEHEKDFLGVTLAQTLEEKLKDTGSFNVISFQETQKYAQQLKINPQQYDLLENAILIGKEAKADAIVIGNFTLLGYELKAFAQVIDVNLGKDKVTKSMNDTASGTSAFSRLDKFAQDVSNAVKAEFKPEPPKTKMLKYNFVFPKDELNVDPKKVIIIGDFTNWQPVQLDYKQGKFSKELEIDILKSVYEYKYSIDGKDEEDKRKIKFKIVNGLLVEEKELLQPGIGLRAGYLFGSGKTVDRLIINPFAITLFFKMQIPSENSEFLQNLGLEPAITFFTFSTDKNNQDNKNSNIDVYDISYLNLVGSLFITYKFKGPIIKNFYIVPKIGPATIFQSIDIKQNSGGSLSKKEVNFMPAINSELDFYFYFSKQLALSVGYNLIVGLDKEMILFNSPNVGLLFSF